MLVAELQKILEIDEQISAKQKELMNLYAQRLQLVSPHKKTKVARKQKKVSLEQAAQEVSENLQIAGDKHQASRLQMLRRRR